jgi:hypothetical protein
MTPVTTTAAVEQQQQQQQQQQQHPPNQHQSVVSKYQEQRRKICEESYLQPFLLHLPAPAFQTRIKSAASRHLQDPSSLSKPLGY